MGFPAKLKIVRCSSAVECESREHVIDCPMLPDSQRAERYKGLYKGMLDRANVGRIQRERLSKEIEFWRGKFREVKHENNKLRRKLSKSKNAETTEHISIKEGQMDIYHIEESRFHRIISQGYLIKYSRSLAHPDQPMPKKWAEENAQYHLIDGEQGFCAYCDANFDSLRAETPAELETEKLRSRKLEFMVFGNGDGSAPELESLGVHPNQTLGEPE